MTRPDQAPEISAALPRSQGFPPVARADARVLVLGSLPGKMSLERRQYYAQPRNAFWPIMGALFDAGPEHFYEERLRRLQDHHVALWDVCASAKRPGSLDHRIDLASVTPNDFKGFLADHGDIALICFNGATAARLFDRLVAPGLDRAPATVQLPSTSPAHATLGFESKLAKWRAVRDF
ncbi:DNA-deoxyinosine glycosylase [Methylocystis heyeri]|uniref:DNA-deoxyinosine glycosylase n=1 Tax=Methylocystis heyeri TaxID=391905 RepID=A0A6B8KE71_9HYPH|nr:DNA-deoxyinosine glycosylase [Methylocystis heyeri]QGM44858.1 DNA-deoxyinosine glycosylase [Methylocystis heyeri]